jgi:Sec-independent protein translocase protein TatA
VLVAAVLVLVLVLVLAGPSALPTATSAGR